MKIAYTSHSAYFLGIAYYLGNLRWHNPCMVFPVPGCL